MNWTCTDIVSRKPNQALVIGSDILIRVVSTTENQTVLSIARPSDITVFRLEHVEAQPSLVPWFRRN